MTEEQKDHLTLKWGTLKSWSFNSDKALELLKEYSELGCSMSAIMQRNTSRQKEILCELIDEGNFETVYLDWDGEEVSKEEAKKYVMEYESSINPKKMITKQQVETLIDGLATRGEVIEEHEDGTKTFIFCPILIGDVFGKIYDRKWSNEELQSIFPNALSQSQKRRGVTLHRTNIDNELIKLWRNCRTKEKHGFTSSLQEIYNNVDGDINEEHNKSAHDLFSFLISIFNEP